MQVAILLLISFQFTLLFCKESVFLPDNGNDPIFKAKIGNIISSIKKRENHESKDPIIVRKIAIYGYHDFKINIIMHRKDPIIVRKIAIYGYHDFKINIIMHHAQIIFLIKQHDWSVLNRSQRNALEKIFDFSIIILKNPIENMLRYLEKRNPYDDIKSIALDNFDFENALEILDE
uniref:DUF4476 domain-containing protein n=1 Tax=Strongyloides papillosus TaxID=174720 RepID=A0A0N5BXU6_STREA